MKVLLVDREGDEQNKSIKTLVKDAGHIIFHIDNIAELLKNTEETPDLIIIDCSFFSSPEDKLVNNLKLFFNDSVILILCQPSNVLLAYKLTLAGFFGFMTRDKDLSMMLNMYLRNINQLLICRSELTHARKLVSRKNDFPNAILGESKGIKLVKDQVQKAISQQNLPVAIFGEGGTEKELVARVIHFNSGRKEGPFLAVNLSAIHDEFMESELFGHERGSGAGAFSRVLGKIEDAGGGTIYISDIAELDKNLQYKLFRVIQERVIRRAGSNRDIHVDTRIIVSTSRDLDNEVKKGAFREDLYYSLLRLTINIPPLSQRGNDILILANHFLKNYCLENELKDKELSPAAKRKLIFHSYPGNVRELHSIIELAALMSDKQVVGEEHILFTSSSFESSIWSNEMTLREFEKRIIRSYLDRYNNNVVIAAKKLDIGKSKIYNMIKKGEL